MYERKDIHIKDLEINVCIDGANCKTIVASSCTHFLFWIFVSGVDLN